MPPKVKPPTKEPTKRVSIAAAAMPLPAPKPPVNFSVDSTDKFLVSYYCESSQDYADVVFHINGVLRDKDYRVSVAMDGKASCGSAPSRASDSPRRS